MTKKIFGTKQITHLIYGILMLLPFLSILSTCAYVSLNKNAYQSYSQSEEFTYYEKQEIKTNDIENTREFHEDYWYYIYFSTESISSGDSEFYYILEDTGINANIIFSSYTEYTYCSQDISLNNQYNADFLQVFLSERKNSSNVINFLNFDDSNDEFIYEFNHVYLYNVDLLFFGFLIRFNQSIDLSTLMDTISISQVPSIYLPLITTYEEKTINQSTLDNTFDYSIAKFVRDNDNYNIHFFDWFGNLFLKNGNTGVNAIYLNFINWYLNYALLVSVGYILFLLMLWFINFVRKILEGGNSFGHGGF